MHKKTIDEILKEFKTSQDGLTAKEALFRLKKYGANELKVKKETVKNKIIFFIITDIKLTEKYKNSSFN